MPVDETNCFLHLRFDDEEIVCEVRLLQHIDAAIEICAVEKTFGFGLYDVA